LIPNLSQAQVEIVKQGWINKQGGAKGGRKSWFVACGDMRGGQAGAFSSGSKMGQQAQDDSPDCGLSVLFLTYALPFLCLCAWL
jgi:hypothetical protein